MTALHLPTLAVSTAFSALYLWAIHHVLDRAGRR